jgi:hydrogenase-4 component E
VNAVAYTLVLLAFAVLGTRRRSTAILLVTLQSLVLAGAALALAPGRSGEFLLASIALTAKALFIGSALLWTLRRTRERRPLVEDYAPLARIAAAAAFAGLLVALMPRFGLPSRVAEAAVVALVAIGLAIAASRKATLMQVLGLIVAENGVAFAAAAAGGGVPLVIEVGVVFDLIVVIAVAAAFHERIFGELGTGDSTLLRGLRD